MLSAPDPVQEEREVMVVQKHVPVEQYLPGLPSSNSDKANAFLHCRGAGDLVDSACFATVVKGGRCSRPRMKHSNFCKQHSHEVLKHERQQECWQAMAESVQDNVVQLASKLNQTPSLQPRNTKGRLFSQKTFRCWVLQKIVGVCHTMHINKRHSTYIFSIRIHSTRILSIRIPSIRIISIRIPPIRIPSIRIDSAKRVSAVQCCIIPLHIPACIWLFATGQEATMW